MIKIYTFPHAQNPFRFFSEKRLIFQEIPEPIAYTPGVKPGSPEALQNVTLLQKQIDDMRQGKLIEAYTDFLDRSARGGGAAGVEQNLILNIQTKGKELAAQFREEMEAFRRGIQEEFQAVRRELRGELASFRGETKDGVEEVRAQMNKFGKEVRNSRQIRA